jgi:hypothetical protein
MAELQGTMEQGTWASIMLQANEVTREHRDVLAMEGDLWKREAGKKLQGSLGSQPGFSAPGAHSRDKQGSTDSGDMHRTALMGRPSRHRKPATPHMGRGKEASHFSCGKRSEGTQAIGGQGYADGTCCAVQRNLHCLCLVEAQEFGQLRKGSLGSWSEVDGTRPETHTEYCVGGPAGTKKRNSLHSA